MAQVSKIQLHPEVWEKIFDLFVSTLVSIKDKDKFSKFVNDFFSPTEKIVFAKRLATAVLLAKDNDYDTIRKKLRVSPPTIAKMNFKLKYGGQGLKSVISEIVRKDRSDIIWEQIAGLLDLPGKGVDLRERGKRKYKRDLRISALKEDIT